MNPERNGRCQKFVGTLFMLIKASNSLNKTPPVIPGVVRQKITQAREEVGVIYDMVVFKRFDTTEWELYVTLLDTELSYIKSGLYIDFDKIQEIHELLHMYADNKRIVDAGENISNFDALLLKSKQVQAQVLAAIAARTIVI